MKFLNNLQDTKLSTLGLLDLAYVIVLLPLLFMLKIPMLVFIFIVGTILFLKKTPASTLLILFIFFLGIVAVYLSLYGAFSFRGLSRLKLFLELLVYLLLVVVSMQRLTRHINYYLLISPFLLLALSLFFYYGMFMLIYVIFEIFFLLWMILTHRMEGNLLESFRASMVMFLYSLPWVVLLFIFFPRISFEHATYGFKGENIQRLGHDGTMYLDSKALLVPSDRIVMEVGFDKEVPLSSTLYFRGSMLYLDKKDHWEPLSGPLKRSTKPTFPIKKSDEKITNYKVTLYPTQKRWIYLLDTPYMTVKDATLDADLISTVKKPIKEPMHYAASSYLSPKFPDRLDDLTFNASTDFDKEQNPQTYEAAKKIKESFSNPSDRARALLKFFKTQDLVYSLKPEALDLNHTTDSFLFDTRRGYCVHFASSFVTMSRMAGIPSRIVTGYKADKSNGLKNYLAVKERDAHAWAELYLDKHWVRVETTATATSIDAIAQAQVMPDEHSALYKTVNLYLMYAKYQVETWILYYSHIRQLQLLNYAKSNPTFIFLFGLSLIALLLATLLMVAYFKRPHFSSEGIAILQPLLHTLNKEGYARKSDESLHQYFLRYLEGHPQRMGIKEIDECYEKISYGNDHSKASKEELKRMVKSFLRNK